MLLLCIYRIDINPDKDCIFGDARLYDESGNQLYHCVSLERYSKKIPSSSYIVDITYSPKFKKNMLHVCDVPHRSGIRIHSFNFAYQSQGCIALGLYRSEFTLCRSSSAIKVVQRYIAANGGKCLFKVFD